jgi:hypothetical protein
LFVTSLENIEYSILIETEARTMKWGWLFRTYVQWHAIAFLLSELCTRTKGEAVERAWRALEATAGRWWFPLHDTSPYSKGRQGFLWLPLRKLLAKAKAARDKELALERASMAIRNGQSMYEGNPRDLDQIKLPPVSLGQTGSDTLDQMLRPSAPKLGESPRAVHPSWPSSPASSMAQDSLPNGVGGNPTEATSMDYNARRGTSGSPGHDFVNLASFGLDNVVRDVMQDIDYNGDSIYDFSNMQQTGNLSANMPSTTQVAQQPAPVATHPNRIHSTANALNSAHGTFGDTMFASANFDGIPPVFDSGTNGVPSGSPSLDGNMDWTLWDDMVNQYGLDGNPPNANANLASNGGLLNWF